MGLNAQTAVPVFTAGQVLTALQQTQINTGIPVFANTSARDAAFGGTGEKTLAEGQFAYLEDTNVTQFYDGAAWQSVGGGAWTAYTPTLGNATLGNGTLTGTYIQLGKLVIGRASFTFGTTSSLTGFGMTVSLPVTASSSTAVSGNTLIGDTGTTTFFGAIFPDTTTRVIPAVYNVSATYATIAGLTTAVPMTWANTDTLVVNFIYEAA
jgi:hypothetical protein